MKHDAQIDWPNGLGYTPCSREYRDTMDRRDAILDPRFGQSLEDLAPADYDHWMRLDNELNEMMMTGHLGRAVRY